MQTEAPNRTAMPPPSQWRLLPFYFGVLTGPMGGGILPVMFVTLRQAFDVDRTLLSLALPAYMFPFAIVQILSGGISDLTSRRSSLLFGFGSFGLATLLAGLAPNFQLFLLAQVLQGATNAFTSPLVMATLGDIVPGKGMGRTMGMFATATLTGAMIAPLLAGYFGDISWRLAYIVVALLTWLVTVWIFVWFRRYGSMVPPRRRTPSIRNDLRSLVRSLGVQIIFLVGLAFLASSAMRGPVYLFTEYVELTWNTGVQTVGLILATYGLAGLLIGPFAGDIVERVGVRPSIALSAVGMAASLILMAISPTPLLFAGANFLLGATGIFAWTSMSMLTVLMVPSHRGTASSIFGSARFMAQGISPFWFTPLYQSIGPRSVFVIAAACAMAVLIPLAALQSRQRSSTIPVGQESSLD